MIAIRPIGGHDEDRIRLLLMRNANDLNWSAQEATWRADEIASDATICECGVKAIVAAEQNEDNGVCVGAAILHKGDHYSNEHTARLRLVVDNDYRGQRLGTLLVKKAIEFAKEHGILRIEAQPYSDSDYVEFWSRLGFKYEGKRRKAARRIGTEKLVNVDVWAWTA